VAVISRTALVGGGAAGIGRAVAVQLAEAGTDVVLLGRDRDRLATAARDLPRADGVRVGQVVGDIADPASAETAIAAVEAGFGRLDVLVLNAGGPPPGRILDLDDAAWRDAAELLLLGPLRFARLALPRMAKQGFGRVVVVTSTAVRQPQPDLALSVVLRAAVTSAVKLLSREYAADGVTVNCVAPGATDTGRRRQILHSRASTTGATLEDLDRADTAAVPAGRAARPQEIAAAIGFLASEAASYVNGTVLCVDGGRTETI
jgi:3-oxoacyl-[acyl-carrier protein] reductase